MKYSRCFFFKEKTAYGVGIRDWSSDVCSSDFQPRAASETGETSPPGIHHAHPRLAPRRTPPREAAQARDRKSVVSGKSVSGHADLGGRRIITIKANTK